CGRPPHCGGAAVVLSSPYRAPYTSIRSTTPCKRLYTAPAPDAARPRQHTTAPFHTSYFVVRTSLVTRHSSLVTIEGVVD
ncbi:MAG: hypothetical protein AVDCRST_MAG18-2954, partial [uncultured Thermomicrobiales bacterium]